jgi:hypothetical protein
VKECDDERERRNTNGQVDKKEPPPREGVGDPTAG